MSNINFFRIMVGIATPFLEPTSRAICYRYFQTVGKPVLECETSRIINAITYLEIIIWLMGIMPYLIIAE